MNWKLLSCEKFEIPEALALDHGMLRADLMRAATQPGRIGKVAAHAAQLCLGHFADEEKNVIRAFGLLHDLPTDRVRSDRSAMVPMIAQLSAQHHALRGQHQPLSAALEELLQEARKGEHEEIADLVDNLKEHERIEDQVMYPTLLFIDRSLRNNLEV